jgi:hypothetical protein
MTDMNKPDTWLRDCARSVASQNGEDGIIEKMLEVIGEGDKWCVEFGSWDGKRFSNTNNLIINKDYSAVLIEGDEERYRELLKTYESNQKVISKNAFVGFEKDDSLDVILGSTEIPEDFDLLSIDIDGNDYHVWEAVRSYRPKSVVIEFNPTIPPEVKFVQPRDMSVTQGSSLLSMAALARSRDYELVAVEAANAFFVDAKYYEMFGIEDNSVNTLWTDRSAVTHIFCGYDGTVFVRGNRVLPWQGISYKESKVQQIPKWARRRVGDRSILRKKLAKIYRRLRRNGDKT